MLRNTGLFVWAAAFREKPRCHVVSAYPGYLGLRGWGWHPRCASHETARRDWIEIPVAVLRERGKFCGGARRKTAAENKIRSRRRTITPSIVKGHVSCQNNCGVANFREPIPTAGRVTPHRSDGSGSFCTPGSTRVVTNKGNVGYWGRGREGIRSTLRMQRPRLHGAKGH